MGLLLLFQGGAGGPQQLFHSTADTLALSEAVTRLIRRVAAESAAFSETLRASASRRVMDALTPAEALAWTGAKASAEAVALASSLRPDVILMDVNLIGEMDGV